MVHSTSIFLLDSPICSPLLVLVGHLLLPLGQCISATPPRTSNPRLLELYSSGQSVVSADESGTDSAHEDGVTLEVKQFWPDPSMTKKRVVVARLLGGTKPRKVRIGNDFFVEKTVLEGEPQGIMMEALANNLYAAARVKAPECRYYPGKKREDTFTLCRFIDGLQTIKNFTQEVKNAVSENLVLDALLGSFDLGGVRRNTLDNTVSPRGNIGWDSNNELVRIDNGGSLAADGMGKWKTGQYNCSDRINYRILTWSPEPFQLWDFQHYTDAWKLLEADQVVRQVEQLMDIKEELLATVEKFGSAVATDRVKTTLTSRLECLGRIAKKRRDLFDPSLIKNEGNGFYQRLPSKICEGVRSVCSDLITSAKLMRQESK